MANQPNKGLKRLVNAFGYSIAGFKACYQNEEAFRQEVVASVVIIPLALWLGETGVERGLLLLSWLLVPLVELLNSALEATVDRFGAEHHDLSGRAKDIGSAAVFTALVIAALIWGLVLLV